MERRTFVKISGMSAIAVTMSGFELMEKDGITTTDCPTSTDILGPFFRPNAPIRHDLSYQENNPGIPLIVKGQIFGSDCTIPLQGVELDVWHCDHEQNYDMHSDEYRCRAKIKTDEQGQYWFKTFVPPPYARRPKHIHYLVHEYKSHQKLVTQLYFKGDDRIQKDNWITYPWDEKRIFDIYKNNEGQAHVTFDLYLSEQK